MNGFQYINLYDGLNKIVFKSLLLYVVMTKCISLRTGLNYAEVSIFTHKDFA